MWVPLVRWAVFVAVAITWIFLIRTMGESSAPGTTAPVTLPTGATLTARFLFASVFSLIYCGFHAFLLMRTAIKRPHPAWLPPRRGERWPRMLFAVAMGVAAYFIVRAAFSDGTPRLATSPSGYEILLSVLPCLLFLLNNAVFLFTYRRLDSKRRWEAQGFLHRPYTLDAGDDGLTLEEPASMHRYQWSYFPGFRETLNLLLLYVSPYGFWIIPKRAFATTEELEAFKAMLLTHVKTGVFLPRATSGFPVRVLPLPPAPPQAPPEREAAQNPSS